MNNALNLQEINQEQALNLSKFFIRSHKNLFLFGQKGVGKSEIVLQAAKECNLKVNYINLSVIERADMVGLPNLYDPGDIVTFKSPAYLPKLLGSEKANTIILFDEVDKAPQEVTAPLLEILQFRTINGTPVNVAACVLTGNLPNERAYSNQISTALLDRGAKYILSFDFEKWIEWAKSNDINDLILAFLRSNPELACGKIEDSCYASPSPRGWTLASEALIKARDLKIVDIDTVTQVISGFVGEEAGIRFKIWYEHFRKFEPIIYSLIDGKLMTFDFYALTPSERAVFIVSACYLAKQKVLSQSVKSKQRCVYLDNLCNFFSKYQVDHELQVMGLCNSFSFDKIAYHKLYECKTFFNLFTKLNDGITLKKS